jgi:ATP-dependent protease ClpP protease subunit
MSSPTSRYIVPEFRERSANGERIHNPYTKLFEERIIFLGVQIDDASADDVSFSPWSPWTQTATSRSTSIHRVVLTRR